MRTRHGLVIIAILVISTAPLYAQRQQQDVTKLKADARNTVGIIGGGSEVKEPEPASPTPPLLA
jgi:hypothetical protein